MGILESDLPNLPYKPMYWQCCVKDCRGKAKIRDYGISPFYFWPVKVIREIGKDGVGRWRGGWINYDHGYICSKHFPEYKKGSRSFYEKYIFTPLNNQQTVNEYLKSKIVEPKTKAKCQHQAMKNWKRSEGW